MLDPFVAQSSMSSASAQEKVVGRSSYSIILCSSMYLPVTGLREIISSTQTAMLTTRSPDGHLHSRAMAPASCTLSLALFILSLILLLAKEDKEQKFIFLANNVSHKFDEMKNDEHVNVAFINRTTTAWASCVLSCCSFCRTPDPCLASLERLNSSTTEK